MRFPVRFAQGGHNLVGHFSKRYHGPCFLANQHGYFAERQMFAPSTSNQDDRAIESSQRGSGSLRRGGNRIVEVQDTVELSDELEPVLNSGERFGHLGDGGHADADGSGDRRGSQDVEQVVASW